MLLPSELFCAVCGAANSPQDSQCFACHQPLQPSTPPATPQTHQLLRQRYQLLNRLGQGGMGSVYQAEDIELGKRLVAIKELSQRGLNQHEAHEAEESFKHEALLLAGLMHPNLPRIYANFSESGRWYLVMDFIEGETLDDYLINKGGKLPWSELFEIATQICNVLHYLHTRPTPIIFRDLKPLNIMVTPTRQIYLIDFGIARLFKPGQARDTIAFGSPGYAAPEQYGKAQTAPSADIYSLGAIIHQMLTGRDPSTTPFSFPSIPNIAAKLQALLDQMLILDASQRLADAEVVKQTLQSIDSTRRKYKSSTIRTPTTATTPLYTPPAQRPAPAKAAAPPIKQVTPQPAPSIPRIPVPTGPLPTLGNVTCLYQGHMDVVSSLSWSPNSDQIASASYDKTIQIWDIADGHMQTFYRGHTGPIRDTPAVVWSPLGKLIASTSDKGIVQIWQIDPLRTKINYREHKNNVRAIAWSPDGTLLASTSQNNIHIWHPGDGKTLTHFAGAYGTIFTITWSPDSTQLALGYESSIVQILRLNTHKATLEPSTLYMEHHKSASVTAEAMWPIHKVVWSPDGQHIASASADKTIHIWDAATGKRQLTYRGHTETIYTLDWSPDSTSIVSSSADGSIQIWDAQDGTWRHTHSSRNPTVYAIAWSPNGTYIASGAHRHIMVWQAQ
jgi:eukaryotic-like serine/threonine-protein kinase